MKVQMIHELIRFTHLEKTYGHLPGMKWMVSPVASTGCRKENGRRP